MLIPTATSASTALVAQAATQSDNHNPFLPLVNTQAFGGPQILAACTTIWARGLNRITCSLTGGAFATLDPSEILACVSADFQAEFCDADRLVDLWELRHWTMCTRPAPALRLATPQTIRSILSAHNADGDARLLAYMLTRLIDVVIPPNDAREYLTFERFQFLNALHTAVRVASPATRANVMQAAASLAQADGIRAFGNGRALSTTPWVLAFRDAILPFGAMLDSSDWTDDAFQTLAVLALDLADQATTWAARRSDESIAEDAIGHKKVRLVAFESAKAAAAASASAVEVWEEKTRYRKEREAEEAAKAGASRVAKSTGARTRSEGATPSRNRKTRGVVVPSPAESKMNAAGVKTQASGKPLTQQQIINAKMKSLDLDFSALFSTPSADAGK